MKFYLDTANVKEIQEAASLGLLDGVTTNPSLVAKEGRSFKEMLVEICNIVDGPISAEVVSVEADAMVKEGKELAKIHKNIVVKVPLIAEGLKATKRMAAEGIIELESARESRGFYRSPGHFEILGAPRNPVADRQP